MASGYAAISDRPQQVGRGWERIGEALAALSPGAREARAQAALGDQIALGRQDQALRREIMQTGGLEGLGDSLVSLGVDAKQAEGLAGIGRAGLNPSNFTGALGDLLKQGYQREAYETLRNLDDPNSLPLGNRILMAADGKPVDLTKISDGIAYNPMATPGLGDMLVTPVGQAEIGAKRASAASNAATANATNQRLTMAREQFAMERAGQWDPDGQTQGQSKSLPVGALRMAQDARDALSVAGGIDDSLRRIHDQLAIGKLNLGPMRNLISRGQNAAGISDENSRNYQMMMSSLEKLRNDSLRLNKGVQTEGDAQRAWNELMANVSDERAVMAQLQRLVEINDRGRRLQQENMDAINANYGRGSMDDGLYRAVEQGVHDGTPKSATRIRRYNAATGRIE